MKIIGSVKISPKSVILNGEIKHSLSEENWTKEIYQWLQLDYSKFYKMDILSKMAFLGTEILKSEISLENFKDDEIALLFANESSSLNTDRNFQESCDKNSPSPSLFVYTLPNILTGEIAIRNKWYGENAFFVEKEFNPDFYIDHSSIFFGQDTKACICGWVESETEECFIFVLTNETDENQIENIKQLFNQ